ncbi:MAG TPA: chemotaxis response regulator protein-glutamate methylesterase [Terriglobales bacterium]|nr:chemotaxis response regulator protein-glutamate methylesterase [Terriglobales bacterium]
MASARRTRILIVDDSAVMRSLLRSVVCSDANLEVAGTAADGASALSSLALNHPDLILLDVEMPVMDGLVTLRELRRRGNRMPVIMCSSLTQRGAKVTIEALAGGASDYVTKPAGQSGREAALHTLAQELIPKIHALTNSSESSSSGQPRYQSLLQPQPVFPGIARTPQFPPIALPANALSRPQPISATPAVVAIGVSTGGPAALDVLLPMLPAHFPLPVLIVQHMPELFTCLFAERLNGRCNLRVREASEGDPVCAGNIYIARGNWHLEAQAASLHNAPPTLRLNQGPLENHCRPAVDVLFRSVAKVYGFGVLAVVLTGMGSDGMLGCRKVREQGGSVLAQDEASSTVWGMPGAVTRAGLAHRVLPLDAIAPEILRIAGRARTEVRQLPRDLVRQGLS